MRDALGELHRRGIPAETFVAKRLDRGQLPLDPQTLIWPSTLADVERRFYDEGERCFVTPRERLKRFTGFVCASAGDVRHASAASRRTAVWCAEIVQFSASIARTSSSYLDLCIARWDELTATP